MNQSQDFIDARQALYHLWHISNLYIYFLKADIFWWIIQATVSVSESDLTVLMEPICQAPNETLSII